MQHTTKRPTARGRPLYVRSGSVRVPVYSVPVKGRKRWEVRDHFGGGIHRRKFAHKARAIAYAEERAIQMANGASARYRLTEAQAWELEQALEMLQPTGKS